jgi:hypothetical protein
MRSLSAKIIGGKIVTRARLPEGAKVTIFVHESDREFGPRGKWPRLVELSDAMK